MNRYQDMMDKVPIPAGQAERLKTAVLAAGPKGKRRIYRPRSFAKKVLLAALIAAALLTATVGAAVAGVNWDRIFSERLGEDAAASPVAEQVFQEIQVSAVCDDVKVTVRQAVEDERTLYLLWEYQLPENVDIAAFEEAWEKRTLCLPDTAFVSGEELTWDDVKNMDGVLNEKLERSFTWPQYGSCIETLDFDAGSRTLTFLEVYIFDETVAAQEPLTMLVGKPLLSMDEWEASLVDCTAAITFRPSYMAQSRSGERQLGSTNYRVLLTPLSIRMETLGHGTSPSKKDIGDKFVLRYRDGTTAELSELCRPYWIDFNCRIECSERKVWVRTDTTAPFRALIDPSQVEAVLFDGIEIPLS